jgi:mannosyltransferase
VAAAVGYVGAGVPSYWGDEAASVMSAERDWPSLIALLGNVDVVHGLYYALLHVWVDLFGASEWSTRALSSIAVGLLAAGTVVLGTRWFGIRIGVLAGLVCAILPRTTYLAVEARSYALAAAAAVWLTVALVALIRRGRTEYWRWGLYGLGLAASIVLFLHLGLLVVVHAVLVAAQRPRPAPRVVRGWTAGTALGLLLVSPFVVAALMQQDQLGYLALRDWARPEHIFVTQWFVTPGVAAIGWILALAGVVATLAAARRAGIAVQSGLWPVLAWAVVPTAALLLVDAAITKTYSPRYVSFCLPAIALLIAIGIERVARAVARALATLGAGSDASRSAPARPWHPDVAAAALLAVCALVAAPTYLEQRTELAKDGGADFRAVADHVREHARPGDAVLFGIADRRSREPRLALRLYPDAFAGLVDAQLTTSFDALPGLWDEVAPLAAVASDLDSPTVWAVDATGSPRGGDEQRVTPIDPSVMEEAGYRLAGSERFARMTVSEYVRDR